jgi:hypothetical protein
MVWVSRENIPTVGHCDSADNLINIEDSCNNSGRQSGDCFALAGNRIGQVGVTVLRVTQDIAVVNAGIGGNRLLQSMPMFGAAALDRFAQDVFSVPVSYAIVLEGINDIGMSGPRVMFGDAPLVDPQALIAAYTQIIERSH